MGITTAQVMAWETGIFIPPVYFLARQKWGGFVLNSILYGLACLCILMIVGIAIAPVFWALAVGHAGFTYRKELLAHHADMIATKMAEKLQNQPPKA
jgi:hypothetical protein